MELNAPVWNDSHIFTSIDDPKISTELDDFSNTIEKINSKCQLFSAVLEDIDADHDWNSLIGVMQEVQKKLIDFVPRFYTLYSYTHNQISVDNQNSKALELLDKLQQFSTNLSKARMPFDLLLMRASDSVIKSFLADDQLDQLRFSIFYERENKDFLLPLIQENTITTFSTDGLHAWGNLYNQLNGSLKGELGGKMVGLAELGSMLNSSDRSVREKAWKVRDKIWEEHKTTAAAILNAINGWRIEDSKLRSSKKEKHYLDSSCHQSHIKRETLEALISTTYENRAVAHQAMSAMSRLMGIEKMAPWDLLAGAPVANDREEKLYTFDEGIEIVSKAFGNFHTDMGEFAKMMYHKGWIDGKSTPNRSPGAYCTTMDAQNEPRVFLTYNGTIGDIITLAHELGHAYHNWVMRDLPFYERHYPMTLAETASIFAETLLRDYLLETLPDDQKVGIAWENAASAEGFMLNIPSRFEFEKSLVETRKGKNATADEMKELMNSAWGKWYEDSLSEYDNLFWANKLHFHMSGLGFYNYPYLFGYLFSLGVYAQKQKWGEEFYPKYVALLRDTGKMTAEQVIQKHLGKDITQKEFWQDSISIVEKNIEQFRKLAGF